MGFTLKVNLWVHKKDKKGLCPIAISIRGNGCETYHNTGFKIPIANWDGEKITKGVDNFDIKNAKIAGILKDVEREVINREMQGEILTVYDLKKMINPDAKDLKNNFTQFYRAYIDNLIATNKKAKGTIAIWETEYHNLILLKGDNIPFAAITASWLNDYHQSLIKYQPTTIFKKLKKVRQIIHNAIDQGFIDKKQVSGFEMVKYVAPEKNYLTMGQTESIAKAIYGGKLDADYTMKQTACYFLIGCYSGLRISDIRRFTVETLIHGENLKVRTLKNKENIYIPLNVFTKLRKIIYYVKDNNIQFNITDQTANKNLKFLKDKVKPVIIQDITFHTSRHTAATLLGELGYSAFAISQILGISEGTAQGYRKATKKGLEREFTTIGGL